jgi:hypothetical protein
MNLGQAYFGLNSQRKLEILSAYNIKELSGEKIVYP